VAVNIEDELRKSRGVDDAQAVSFSWLEGEGGVHVEAGG
jgi:hypothetical protein